MSQIILFRSNHKNKLPPNVEFRLNRKTKMSRNFLALKCISFQKAMQEKYCTFLKSGKGGKIFQLKYAQPTLK